MGQKSNVTWLMPVLNGMPYLPSTLEAIANQTFHDFELLAWDNGSTDGSVQELLKWLPSRIGGRVITGQPLGLGACLAEMVRLSNGVYCARIDADDICHPQRLGKQIDFLESHPKVVAVGTQVRAMRESGAIEGQHHDLPCTHEDIVTRMLRYWSMWHPTVTFRRAAALASGNYRDEKPVEDYSLWLRLARVGRLANLPDCLLDYRLHEQSVTESFIRSGLLSSSIAKCIATHGHPLYSISEARLFELASGGIQLGLRDVLTLTKSLVSKGHCSVPGLLRSGYYRHLLRNALRL